MVKLTIHKKTDSLFTFTLNECTVSFANSLRRILLSEIPSVAFDLVFIQHNSSVLPDDFLVHRLGLIPVHPKKNLLFPSECPCSSYCADCAVEAKLNVYVNTGADTMTIYSDALKCEDVSINHTIIGKIGKNHKIELTAIGRKGIGRTNAKWSPVTVVEFEYDRDNELRQTKYWFEEDIEKEWPGVREKKNDPLKEVDGIKKGVEVLDGYKSRDITLLGLNVLKEKIKCLINKIETNDEIN